MLRALEVELLKWRRTWFLWVVIGTSLAGSLLTHLFFALQDGTPTWAAVLTNVFSFQLILTGPLTVTLIGAQFIASEYQWDTWKLALTAPLPRWAAYLAKWLVGTLWILGLTLLAEGAALLSALLLHATGQRELIHITESFLMAGLGMAAMLSIYHLITLISRNFFVTSAVGIIATFAGLITFNSKYMGIYPISGNAASVLSIVMHQPLHAGIIGTPTLWIAIELATALFGLLGSLLYVQRADYR